MTNTNIPLDEIAFLDACDELSKVIVIAERKELQIEEVTRISGKLQNIAREHIHSIKTRKGNVNIITHALVYLAHTHAFTLKSPSLENYLILLEAVLEIAYPNVQQSKLTLDFLNDLEHGISLSKKYIEE